MSIEDRSSTFALEWIDSALILHSDRGLAPERPPYREAGFAEHRRTGGNRSQSRQ